MKSSKVTKYVRKHGIDRAVTVQRHQLVKGVPVTSLRVADGYHVKRYKPERYMFGLSAKLMNRYLENHPHVNFEHRFNWVRKFLYGLPGFRRWSRLIHDAGSKAMQPLHNPEVRRLATGQRLDPVTRRLFRHGSDPIGIRTRAITGGWLASQYDQAEPNHGLTWVSLGGSSAESSMLMIESAGINKAKLDFTDIDINAEVLEQARSVTAAAGLSADSTHLIVGSVIDRNLLMGQIGAGQADIIDMMGILEYFEDDRAAELLRLAYDLLKPGGQILACNMRATHPQLALHKRGVGWPGVVPRTVDRVIGLCQQIGVRPSELSIYRPSDGVYNVFRIIKA